MKKLKKLLARLPEAGAARGSLLIIVGCYLIYMAVQMLRDTLSGVSSMTMGVTVIFMILMSLCGLAILAYGGSGVYREWKKQNTTGLQSEEDRERKKEE
ncbi:MAG: hypothetical protein J6T99_05855 [Oscillospiraceae bacterium]|nr:hypothetical protein [Oscillospiraceae bacterium]